MELHGYGRSETGKVRLNNEDSFYCDLQNGVFAVADGIGGKPGGEVASQAVVKEIARRAGDFRAMIETMPAPLRDEDREEVFKALVEAVETINLEVYQLGRSPEFPGGIGTTMDLLVFSHSGAFVLHVGDSRIYLMRKEEIYRVTRDHTFSEHLRDHPGLQERYGEPDRYANVLTRSVGGAPLVTIDTFFVELEKGDRLLMCTDGVTDYLTGSEILELARSRNDEELLVELAREANARGGKDNITSVAVTFLPQSSPGFARDVTRQDTFFRVRFFQNLQLFSELELSEILRMMRFMKERGCVAGESMILRGDPVDGLYVVMSGRFSVEIDGREINRVEAGEHFGEFALFGEPERSADVRCLQDGQLYFISGDHLRQLVTSDPALGNKLLLKLLESTTRRMQQLLKG